MPKDPQLQTDRLLLRQWRPSDVEPCATMNGDPLVMEHFPAALTAKQSAAFIERQQASFAEHGYGLWAVELRGECKFVGCVGLMAATIDSEFTPAVEVAWRLDRQFWGRGVATEAAAAAISFGFDELELASVVAYTATHNLRSRRVMARLGMLRDPAEDFLHPALPAADPLAPHVLYRLDCARWRTLTSP